MPWYNAHSRAIVHNAELCRLAFSINQTRWLGGREKLAENERTQVVYFYVRGIYIPISSNRAKYPPSRPPQQIQTHRLPFRIVCV